MNTASLGIAPIILGFGNEFHTKNTIYIGCTSTDRRPAVWRCDWKLCSTYLAVLHHSQLSTWQHDGCHLSSYFPLLCPIVIGSQPITEGGSDNILIAALCLKHMQMEWHGIKGDPLEATRCSNELNE